MTEFKNTALLITHYNRSQSLRRLLTTFSELNIQFGQIVISDDASDHKHVEEVKRLSKEFNADMALTDQNGGLGSNINKGQLMVKQPFTLYVQEDFLPKETFKKALEDSLDFMDSNATLDIVRYYAYRKYPHLIPFKSGFSYMNFKLSLPGYSKFYAYSDHPHLRRSAFFDKFGKYKEGHNPEQTEYRMMMAFLQKKGKGLFYEDYKNLFYHGNTSEEPSTMSRNSLRRSNNRLITTIRNTYKHLKFNLNYLFGKYT